MFNTLSQVWLVDMLRQRSRPYLFSNTVAPAIVGAAIEAPHPPQRRLRLARGQEAALVRGDGAARVPPPEHAQPRARLPRPRARLARVQRGKGASHHLEAAR